MSETQSKETTRTRRNQLTGQVASSVRIGACDDRHNVLRRHIACHDSPSDSILRNEAARRVDETGQGIGDAGDHNNVSHL